MFSDNLTRLYVSHNKTDADGSTIVPQELREILELMPPSDRHGFVCPYWGSLTPNIACQHFRKKLNALGIVTREKRKDGRGNRMSCVHGYHSFRHTAITRALRNGANPAGVKQLAGHATTAMQEHYTHMGMEDAGRAAALIGRVVVRKGEKDGGEAEKPAEN